MVLDYYRHCFSIQNGVAALTGAGGHLVSEMAYGLAKVGVKIALLDKNLKAIEIISEKIDSMGGKSIVVEVDVTQKKDYQKALDTILTEFGDLNFALYGANLNAPTPLLEISLTEWNSILGVQLTGTMLGLQVFGGYMVEKGKGSIVTISSASADPPLSKAFTYSVAKAGVKNLTQNVAREWAKKGVRVNAIRPGFFPTEWSKINFIDKDRESDILNHTPMGRYGEPMELVGAVLWLFSDAASFVTGAEITVDGGFSAMTI